MGHSNSRAKLILTLAAFDLNPADPVLVASHGRIRGVNSDIR
jgi:hypothetical protein